MKPRITWLAGAGVLMTCLLLVAGCSPAAKDRVLRVFFTGVDRTNAAPGTAVVSVRTNRIAAVPAPVAEMRVHQPYLERSCSACHLTAESQELRAQGADLCLECHEKLRRAAQYVHAPVNDGQCGLCHEPHQSAEPFLLRRRAQELCLDCHAMATMVKVKAHAGTGADTCVSCHDAHKSDWPKLARNRP